MSRDEIGTAAPVHVTCLSPDGLSAYSEAAPPLHAGLIEQAGFKAAPGATCRLSDASGKLERVLLGIGADEARPAPEHVSALAAALPAGIYALEGLPDGTDTERLALAFAEGRYRFTSYRRKADAHAADKVRLALAGDVARIRLITDAHTLVRDLVNMPANDLGPAELEAAARQIAKAHGAEIRTTVGEDLIAAGYHLIHAVGRASTRAPRLIDVTWQGGEAMTLTLVGKGVCFDTGGLNLKPGNFMLQMKKDMGGAAHVLGLAEIIMALKLPVRLRVLVPAVENAVAGNAFRPGDVLESYKGLSVEIGNTDAEGRLILADALALADEEAPDLLIDMATLTGAARQAVGPDLAPFYTDDEDLAAALMAASRLRADPLWRMPFWAPYDRSLDGKVGDINHIGDMGQAGSITAALFLKRFVEKARSFVHFDIFAWSDKTTGGLPAGARTQGLLSLLKVIEDRLEVTA